VGAICGLPGRSPPTNGRWTAPRAAPTAARAGLPVQHRGRRSQVVAAAVFSTTWRSRRPRS